MSKIIHFIIHQLFSFIHLIFIVFALISIPLFLSNIINIIYNATWLWMRWNNPLVRSSISGIWLLAFLFNPYRESINLIQKVGLNLGVTFGVWLSIMMFLIVNFLSRFISSIIDESSVFLLNTEDLLFILSIVTGLAFAAGFLSKEDDPQKAKNKNIILNSFITSIILFIVGMLCGIIPSLKFGIDVALGNGIILGLIFSLFAGFACIQYLALRLTLWWNGYMPWNITRFLDYCTERLILQRVGNRYRFIHRLVQEHFANLEIQKE